jgi:hypothetical protein
MWQAGGRAGVQGGSAGRECRAGVQGGSAGRECAVGRRAEPRHRRFRGTRKHPIQTSQGTDQAARATRPVSALSLFVTVHAS